MKIAVAGIGYVELSLATLLSKKIVTNRMETELNICKDKIYTRDLFSRD
ncbi:MAG: hypothetical protein IJE89_03980 [Bacilli bacterium]|nr:hypothetical protein [Bacilli bacterium]